MSNDTTATNNTIKKLHIEAMVNFAINHIPNVDEATLLKYLELVNVTGNFGSISREQLTGKMLLIMKHIPDACEHSLRTLGELLEVPFPIDTEDVREQAKNGKVVGAIAPHERSPMRPAASWSH